MAKISFRWRNYKSPNKRGTWMLVDGKQVMRISPRHLTRKEIEDFRRQFILTQKGYVKTSKNTYERQISDDHIKEVKEKNHNTEITDIKKDPQTKKWTREPTKDRDYLDKDEELDENLV